MLKAFAAAPVPRPPQPTSATLIVLFSAAYARAEMALSNAAPEIATPDVFRKSRREVEDNAGWSWRLMGCSFALVGLEGGKRQEERTSILSQLQRNRNTAVFFGWLAARRTNPPAIGSQKSNVVGQIANLPGQVGNLPHGTDD